MKHKTLRTLLCVILTVCFCLSAIAPVSAAGLFSGDSGAASIFDEWIRSLKDRFIEKNPGTDETPVEPLAGAGNDFIRIFHLDCGRKYFTVAEIKGIIDQLAKNNYTHIELAFGNDGLRFLLDDMSVTVNDTTYPSESVKSGIQQGNKNYYNAGSSNELTQSEMTEIISYAKNRKISVIPLLNSPGHMDAIIDCMEYLGFSGVSYNNSARTIDLTNANATGFTKALIQKYVTYFADNGCKYFNIGADEYANDVSNGFAALINSRTYGNFVTYVNAIAKMIRDAKMIPMAFNDGIYYNSNTNYGTFDTDIVIAYWTSGWSGYSPASASFLAEKRHKIISTNDAWYYVLGRQAGNSSGYTIATAQNGVKNTACTDIPGDNDPTAAGCMICLWCDTPSASYSDAEVTNVTGLLTTFATKNPTYFVADSGETDPTPDPEPGEPVEVTENETITVTVGGTATATISGYNFAGTYTTEAPSIATVEVTGTPASTTVTFTGVAVGKTYVTVGNTRYTINVVAKDLSEVTPLTVEYWITNLPVTADGATSKAISAQSVYGEAGVDISTLVPETGTYAYGSVVYWKGTVLDSSNKQTTDNGAENDKTGSGKDFNLIRYYNGSWQYFYEADGTWNTISSTDQVVIYWLQPTKVTKEITTLVKDWGFAPDAQGDNANKVALTVAVVYPDGTVSPAEEDMYSTSTTLFNYWENRDIGLVAPINNSDYEIAKITVTNGTRDQSGTGKWGVNDTITWEKVTNEANEQWYNETTYWDETVGGTPMVNGAISNITWSTYNTAKLVLIYLKPVQKDTNLNLVYWDNNTNSEIASAQIVMSYQIGDSVPTYYTALQQTSALPTKGVGGTFTLDDGAYVTNSSNVNQTFNKNISTVPGVADVYKTGLYQYVSADLSADGMTLTLHYNLNSANLSKSYVIDFGLPITIPASDFLNNEASIKKVEVLLEPSYGSVAVSTSPQSITYTPTQTVDATDTIRVKVTFEDQTAETFTIGIIPATNVLYEENFMTVQGTAGDWKRTETSSTTQTTELAGQKQYVYGYDEKVAAKSTVDYSEGAAYTANLTLPDGKKTIYTNDKLTFSFTGTGFDLISDSGKNTGILVVRLDAKNAKTTKTYIIDTYFHGDEKVLNNSNTIYQTPVIRELSLGYDTYTVAIRGALYRSSGAVLQPELPKTNTYSMQASAFDTNEAFDLRTFLDECGLADVSVEDVELIYMDENSVLNGGTGMSADILTPVVQDSNAVSTYAMDTTAVNEGAYTATVSVDGFRVYNPLENNSKVYISDMESGVSYKDLRQYVEDHQDSTVPAPANTKQVLYVEYNSEHKVANIADYNTAAVGTNGPKYEIYLAPGCGIAFALDSQDSIDVLQLSAKVVSGTPSLKVGDEEFKVTATNSTRLNGTEMYFDISSCVKESNGQKYVTIINNAAANYEAGKASVLAVNVLKMGSGIEPVAIDDETQNYILAEFAASMAEPVETFNPEVFDIYAPASARRNRSFSISANVSVADLEKVTITTQDGVETELNPLNKLSVRWGISSEYYYLKTFRMRNSGDYTFKITAYGKDGSSVSKNVTVTVK